MTGAKSVIEQPVAIEAECEIRQVKTMADRTVNVTFNLPEYCADQSAWLLKKVGDMARIVVGPPKEKENG